MILRKPPSLLGQGSCETVGLCYDDLRAGATRCDVLLNISGLLTDEALLSAIATKVYLDLDPGFNQFWHAQGVDVRFAGHTHYVTIGQCIGTPECAVPTCGLSWITTLQPIVLSRWPYVDTPPTFPFTTVGHWRSYGSVTADGVCYGQKAHSFRKIISLPKQTQAKFCMALGIHPAEVNDLNLLADNDWQLVDPEEVAGDPATYQRIYTEFACRIGRGQERLRGIALRLVQRSKHLLSRVRSTGRGGGNWPQPCASSRSRLATFHNNGRSGCLLRRSIVAL